MLNTTCFTSSFLNSSINTARKSICALLFVSCLAVPTASAEKNDEVWFERSDLMLPRQMHTSILTSGLRYVLMPSREEGIVIRLENYSKPIPELDLNPASEEELMNTLELLGKSMMSNENIESMFGASLVVVGQFNVSKLSREVSEHFAKTDVIDLDKQAERNKAHQKAQPDVAGMMYIADRQSNAISVTSLTEVDTTDSKVTRREKLTREIANRVLAARLNHDLELKKLEVASLNASESVAFDGQLMTSTKIELSSDKDLDASFSVFQSTLGNLISAGVSRQEFADQVKILRAELTAKLKPSVVTTADQIVAAIQQSTVYMHPSDELMLFDFYVAHMSEREVSSVLHQVWSNNSNIYINKGLDNKVELGIDLS